MPQLNFVPVRPIWSRITHRSGVAGSTSTEYGKPFTVSSSAMLFPLSEADARPRRQLARAAGPEVAAPDVAALRARSRRYLSERVIRDTGERAHGQSEYSPSSRPSARRSRRAAREQARGSLRSGLPARRFLPVAVVGDLPERRAGHEIGLQIDRIVHDGRHGEAFAAEGLVRVVVLGHASRIAV